jgi:hypothetical protein
VRTPGISFIASVAAALLVAGCGGGGGSTDAQGFLAFTPASGVDPVSTVDSNTVTVRGVGLGRSDTATVQEDPAVQRQGAPTALIRNGQAVGTTTTVQDGDTLQVRTASLSAGESERLTVSVGPSTATWTITSRIPVIGALSTGAQSPETENSGTFYAVPFTPLQSFTARYAGIMEEEEATFEFQDVPVSTAIYSDAQGVPATAIALTTTESRWPATYLGGQANRQTFPILGGGTYQLPSLYVPEADFGASGVALTQGTRYWLVVRYAASFSQPVRALAAATVASGPNAQQSNDGVTWRDWGVPTNDPAARVLPGFFLAR